MAQKRVGRKSVRRSGPAKLELALFAPGMTLMHRAGLGGLAATLLAIERRHMRGWLRDDDLPGGFEGGKYAWTVTERGMTLDFGKPEAARDYLEKLFAIAFHIKDKLIDLPGTYRDELSRAVRTELQLGLTLTFLQFGPHRKLGDEMELRFDVTGEGTAEEPIVFRPCSWYLHQDFWQKLTDSRGVLKPSTLEAPSAFNPGAVVRHVAFKANTQIDETAGGVLCTCFAIVGCLSLPVNRGVGILLAPDVTNVKAFAHARPRMTPSNRLHCRVAGACDAALQAETRLHGKRLMARHGILSVYAMQLQPTQWNEKQKSRVHTTIVARGADEMLRQYDVALGSLPPKVSFRIEKHRVGRGRKARTVEEPVWFRTDSTVRPVVADNLARGQPWYQDFVHLMRDRDTNGNPLHKKIRYEREGLHAMASNSEMTREDELTLIRTLHRAISMRRGRIMRDTMGEQAIERGDPPTQAVKNRWERFMEEVRLSLINAKTESQARHAISEILARAGQVPNLRDEHALASVHALLFGKDWERARDLALLALASYKRPENAGNPSEIPED